MNLGAIVEGHGETEAVPALIRKVVGWLDPTLSVNVPPPIRLPKGSMLKEGDLKKAVELTARKVGPGSPILIVLDADDDLACALGPRLLAWARQARGDREVGVVVATRAYEAWLLASASTLAGHRGLPLSLEIIERPELIPNPKAWMDARMPDGYVETLDQVALTALIDPALARRTGSFDKLVRDLGRLVGRDVPAVSG